ncbi:uncharacterized protein VSU04_005990 [Chlamydotis macqueenii]
MEPRAAWGKREWEGAHAVGRCRPSNLFSSAGDSLEGVTLFNHYTDPGRRSGAPGLPLPPLLRLRLTAIARRFLTKWRRPWKRQPHFVPSRACQQNADLATAEEQKAAARSRYRERREESEGFHRPPAAERRLSIKCARWGREKREVKGDASSERVRGCLIPVRSCRSRGAGEGKAKAGGLGASRAGSAARRRPVHGDPRASEAGGRRERQATRGRAGRGGRGSPGLPGPEALLPRSRPPAQPGRTGPFPANSGEPVMNDRTVWLLTWLTRSLSALNDCLFHFSACLMNKPAIRLMLQVTLSATKPSFQLLLPLPPLCNTLALELQHISLPIHDFLISMEGRIKLQ